MYKVMTVDDSMIIRNLIGQIDGGGKFKVVCSAKNGFEAIEMCKKFRPDIVTLDLTMPKMDGLQTIPKLLVVKPDLDILIVSSLSDQATGLEALELGANGFLTKPFTDSGLKNALMEFIEFREEN